MTSRMFLRAAAVGASLLAFSPAIAADAACVEAWKKDVQRLANSRCVACHQNAAPGGGLSLQRGTAPENLIGQKSKGAEMVYVTPGDPSQSYIYRKLEGTQVEAGGTGERMPLGGKLSDRDLAVFEGWIRACTDA